MEDIPKDPQGRYSKRPTCVPKSLSEGVPKILFVLATASQMHGQERKPKAASNIAGPEKWKRELYMGQRGVIGKCQMEAVSAACQLLNEIKMWHKT